MVRPKCFQASFICRSKILLGTTSCVLCGFFSSHSKLLFPTSNCATTDPSVDNRSTGQFDHPNKWREVLCISSTIAIYVPPYSTQSPCYNYFLNTSTWEPWTRQPPPHRLCWPRKKNEHDIQHSNRKARFPPEQTVYDSASPLDSPDDSAKPQKHFRCITALLVLPLVGTRKIGGLMRQIDSVPPSGAHINH